MHTSRQAHYSGLEAVMSIGPILCLRVTYNTVGEIEKKIQDCQKCFLNATTEANQVLWMHINKFQFLN